MRVFLLLVISIQAVLIAAQDASISGRITYKNSSIPVDSVRVNWLDSSDEIIEYVHSDIEGY